MTLVLLIADTEREQANAARYVRAGHVDGVLLVSSHESDDLLGSLVNAGVPTVCSGIPLWKGAPLRTSPSTRWARHAR
jgi:DNA-binding LacI/PurR family transcriptional regulator